MNSSTTRLRIVVLGYIIRGPLGGMAWHHLQYVAGLHRMGHDVLFIEDSDDYVSCYDPSADDAMTTNYTYGAGFAKKAFERLGIADNWTYYDSHTKTWIGPGAGKALEFCATADVLLNISAVNPLRDWTRAIPKRVLIDTDPTFTQIRHLTNPNDMARAKEHDTFLSFGESVGQSDCEIPSDGFAWKPTRQPVIMDFWPVSDGHADGKFTTVMTWDSYKTREWQGKHYGMKSESFAPYSDLPNATGQNFGIALGGENAPRQELSGKHWRMFNCLQVTLDPWTYQKFIQDSKGEFTIAKQGYVISRSGWFSERSAGYLASGRPVITQETGYSRWYPTGKGLLTFTTPQQAIEAIADVRDNYAAHCKAARAVAEECFDHAKVLTKMLQQIGV